MFISKSERENIIKSLGSLNVMGKNSDVRIDTLCGNIVVAEKDIEKIREDIKTIFVAVNRTNDDVYDVNEIIKKTNIYKKNDGGCSFFDAELTNSSLMALVKRVENLEQSLKKSTKKKVIKNATTKSRKKS